MTPGEATEPVRRPIDGLWDALWEDLRHNATGRPSGLLIVTRHRYAIEAAARAEAFAEIRRGVEAKRRHAADRLWTAHPDIRDRVPVASDGSSYLVALADVEAMFAAVLALLPSVPPEDRVTALLRLVAQAKALGLHGELYIPGGTVQHIGGIQFHGDD